MKYKAEILTGLAGLLFTSPVFGQVDVDSVAKYIKEHGIPENKDGVVDVYRVSLADTVNNTPINYTLKLIIFGRLPNTNHLILNIIEKNRLETVTYSIEDGTWEKIRTLRNGSEEIKPKNMDGYADKGYITSSNGKNQNLGNAISQLLYEFAVPRILKKKR